MLFIRSSFISNIRLKAAENQAEANQCPQNPNEKVIVNDKIVYVAILWEG